MDLDALRWDAAGLVTVVVQERFTGEVRMVGHANPEALRLTIETGQGTFFSRSRQALWRKGESSGNTLAVHEVWTDCDADAVLYLVDPSGPTCHTGARTCFFRRLDRSNDATERDRGAAPTLVRFWDVLEARTRSNAEKSYTRSLLSAGVEKIGAKVREEADELARALAGETADRVVSETADVIYHACVGLLARQVTMREVLIELANRFGRSGHDEKRSRGK